VRRLDAALLSIMLDRDQSGVKPPHSKEAPISNCITTGKSLGWHGVRLGYAATNPRTADLLRSQLPFWNVNGLAAYILKSMSEFKDEFLQSLALVEEDRMYMLKQLNQIPGLRVFPSKANFLYVELPPNVSGRALRDQLLQEYGLMVRECSNKIGSSERYLRLAVQKREAVDLLVQALTRELAA